MTVDDDIDHIGLHAARFAVARSAARYAQNRYRAIGRYNRDLPSVRERHCRTACERVWQAPRRRRCSAVQDLNNLTYLFARTIHSRLHTKAVDVSQAIYRWDDLALAAVRICYIKIGKIVRNTPEGNSFLDRSAILTATFAAWQHPDDVSFSFAIGYSFQGKPYLDRDLSELLHLQQSNNQSRT